MFTSSISIEGLAALTKVKDPVCGMEVDPSKAAGVATHKGKTCFFCATACKTAFESEPEKYLAK